MTEQTYVFGEHEVRLTGRTATRPVGAKTHELVEVTPSNPDEGTWKKWTPLSALFRVNANDKDAYE